MFYGSYEFENKLQRENFDELERQSQETRAYFSNLKEKFKESDVQSKFPAYYNIYNRCLYVKFPTYKIRIINNRKSQNEIKSMLNISSIAVYDEPNVVLLPSLKPVQCTAVHCLETSLEKNESLADRIEEILSKNGICTERGVAYGVYPIQINVDDDGYFSPIDL